MSKTLQELLIRHVVAGTIPGAVALSGAGNAEVVTAGVASIGGGPMGEDAIMRIWNGMGWGFGVAVKTEGPQRGRIGWSGGLGTDFFVDPDGTVGILLTQVEMGKDIWPLIEEFQSLHEPS